MKKLVLGLMLTMAWVNLHAHDVKPRYHDCVEVLPSTTGEHYFYRCAKIGLITFKLNDQYYVKFKCADGYREYSFDVKELKFIDKSKCN